jgi:hypothetical protein
MTATGLRQSQGLLEKFLTVLALLLSKAGSRAAQTRACARSRLDGLIVRDIKPLEQPLFGGRFGQKDKYMRPAAR